MESAMHSANSSKSFPTLFKCPPTCHGLDLEATSLNTDKTMCKQDPTSNSAVCGKQ